MRKILRNEQKRIFLSGVFLSILLIVTPLASAENMVVFGSGEQQVALIELFTSQGCSSSPPAEKWLNKFTNDPRLWTEVVPVAFHVDYWNRLGWQDPFSSNQFTQRQYAYKAANRVGSVYTPGLVLNGKEWRGWFSGEPLPEKRVNAGLLEATLESKQLDVVFKSEKEALILHVAVLGFGIQTDVSAGENKNRQLDSDFVVLAHESHLSNDGRWRITLPKTGDQKAKRYGIAIWVNRPNDPAPLQATGAWLPAEI